MEERREKAVQFPIQKVKQMMKCVPETNIVQTDAAIAVSKAVELFVEFLAEESYSITAVEGRKGLSDKDVRRCIDKFESLRFLDDCLPDFEEKRKKSPLAKFLDTGLASEKTND